MNLKAPAADSVTKTWMRHTVGNKEDAAVSAVGTTKSIVAYVKGILTEALKIGTLVNTGGTATLAGILGDVANVSFATKIGYLLNSAAGFNKNLSNYLTVTADFTSATWNTVATHEIFTVTGTVRCRLVAESTGSGAGATATAKLGVEGNTGGLIAATTITDFVAGELWYDATPTTFMDTVANVVKDFIVSGGKDIGYEIETAAASGGGIKFHLWWEPISSDGAVVAGTGAAL